MVFNEVLQFFMFPENIIDRWEKMMTDDSGITANKVRLEKINSRLKKEEGKQNKWLGLYGDDRIPQKMLTDLISKSKDEAVKLAEEGEELERGLALVVGKRNELALLKKSSKDYHKISNQVLKSIESLKPEEKREFLVHAFRNERFRVRTLTRADLADTREKLSKEEMIKPIIRKEKGLRPRTQVVVEALWSMENLMRGLQWLQNQGKIKFRITPRLVYPYGI